MLVNLCIKARTGMRDRQGEETGTRLEQAAMSQQYHCCFTHLHSSQDIPEHEAQIQQGFEWKHYTGCLVIT
jgi:hypothetical protein